MKSVSITEFKAKCLRLVEDVHTTGEPLQITKRGKPVATVIADLDESNNVSYEPGQFRDTVQVVGDLVSPIAPGQEWDGEKHWF